MKKIVLFSIFIICSVRGMERQENLENQSDFLQGQGFHGQSDQEAWSLVSGIRRNGATARKGNTGVVRALFAIKAPNIKESRKRKVDEARKERSVKFKESFARLSVDRKKQLMPQQLVLVIDEENNGEIEPDNEFHSTTAYLDAKRNKLDASFYNFTQPDDLDEKETDL